MSERRICLGAFAGAHGVKGEAKVKTFTEAPENIAAYGPLETENRARRFNLVLVRVLKDDLVLVRAPEIASREDATSLSGTRLYVDRRVLPPVSDDEFYREDLIGLHAYSESGASLGKIAAVHNFGAGDIVELKGVPGTGGALLLPFTLDVVPIIEIANGRIVVADAALGARDEPANDDG